MIYFYHIDPAHKKFTCEEALAGGGFLQVSVSSPSTKISINTSPREIDAGFLLDY